MLLINDEKDIISKLLEIYPSEDFIIKKFSSGKTNILYHCTSPSNSLVLRIFGDTPFINRAEEMETITLLNSYSRCAPLIKKYTNGYISQYIIGRELEDSELQLKYKNIIKEMKKWHKIKTGTPTIFTKLKDWYIRAYKHHRDFLEKNKILEIIENKEKEINKINFTSDDIGFCHNDLLASNILINKEEIIFIDYEYASINYIHFDIANHLCEYAGYNCNFRLVPKHNFIKKVIKEYYGGADRTFGKHLSSGFLEENINKLLFFIPLAHILWGLWGLIKKKDRDFDYQKYGKIKILEAVRLMSE
ncbi:Choline/ethanolamine kinase [Spraguea lophii 42_110]|uniref:Choline/ethanolamine kinase n=1 Tax=Spraguea lophii (strain 42_110) TaxID=1358809 RepID=S7XIZ9_SPRLO|nr:Choline/ethanolamine kinase [Spraguea lophii 42_110]